MLMKSDATRSAAAVGQDDGAPVALVVGSGFGGMAAAVRLAAKGYKVTVLEKLDAPGGRAYVHHREGHVFDAGPTIVTVPYLFDELWALAGRRFADDVQLVSLDPFYRIRYADGDHFDYSGDKERMRAEVRRICADDLPGFERFMHEADQCYEHGFRTLGDKAFDTVGDLLKAAPLIIKLRGWRSLHQMVASHLKHPKLRIAMSLQSLLIGGNPFSVTSMYALVNALERQWGVHWAVGGTGRLISGLVDVLEGMGGTIRLKSEVARIEIDDGVATGVTLASGERIRADIVVCNGDTGHLYKNLVDARWRRHWTDARIERGHYSMGLFVWYFGTDRRYDDVPHHMMVLGPRYRELLDDIFRKKKLAGDFSIYLHRPTATDPTMAPEGCDTFYALSPVPHLDSGTDWQEQAEPYRQAIQEALERTVLPGLGQHLRVSFCTTPLDFKHRLLSHKGAAFGLEPLLLQSAYFRPHNRSEDVKNLFMVGASTHPGAGVPGVIMSAKALETVLPDPAVFRRG